MNSQNTISLPVAAIMFLVREYGISYTRADEPEHVGVRIVEPNSTHTLATGAYRVFGSGDAWASVKVLHGDVLRSEERDCGNNGFVGYWEREVTLPQGSVILSAWGAEPGPDVTQLICAMSWEEVDALAERGREWCREQGSIDELRQELAQFPAEKLPHTRPGRDTACDLVCDWGHLPERAWLALAGMSPECQQMLAELADSAPRFCECGIALDPERHDWGGCAKCEAHREAQLRKEAAELAAYEEQCAIASAMAMQRQLVCHGSARRARALRRVHY